MDTSETGPTTHDEKPATSTGLTLQLDRGDIVYRPTMKDDSFFHEGIYVGDDKVIHVYPNKGYLGVSVRRDTLEGFARGKPLRKKTAVSCVSRAQKDKCFQFSKEDVARRAESRLGEGWHYDPIAHNCESFTNWAATGTEKSDQGDLTWLCGVVAASYALDSSEKRDLSSLLAGFVQGLGFAKAINAASYNGNVYS